MNANQHPSLKRTADLALDFIDKTNIRSAYDRLGQLSHLVATLPRREFYRLYPATTTANVFLSGHWLQFSHARSHCWVTHRHTGARLQLALDTNAFGVTTLTFARAKRIVYRLEFSLAKPETLFTTSHGMQRVAKAALRAFERIQGGGCGPQPQDPELPSVHVIPEREAPREFSSAFVNLQ